MARKTKPERIREKCGLAPDDMMKVLQISRATWWRWSTGKTPWAKIDPLRRDILDALWVGGSMVADADGGIWSVNIPGLNARAGLHRLLQVVVILGWTEGRGIDREAR